MTITALFLTSALCLYLLVPARQLGFLSVSSLFVYAQYVMGIGVVSRLDYGIPADETHRRLVLGTFLALVITTAIYAVAFSRTRRPLRKAHVDTKYPTRSLRALLFVTVAICLAYYAAVGHFALIESIQSLISGGDDDIAGYRLESYAGSRYLFPGYVNQFKNSLLPALVLVVIYHAYESHKKHRLAVAILLTIFTTLMLLGTGQRAPFFRAVMFVVVALYLISKRTLFRVLPLLIIGGLAVFFLATFATGRAQDDLSASSGAANTLSIFFEQLTQRIFGSSQYATVIGFRYIYYQDIPLGSEWLQSLVGLLPGRDGPGTANEIFALIYGSTRGTAPLSLWASAYYNFGLPLTVILASVLAILFAIISEYTNNLTTSNTIELVGIAGVYIAFGTWITESVTTPLNAGLPAFLLLWIWGKKYTNQSNPDNGLRLNNGDRKSRS